MTSQTGQLCFYFSILGRVTLPNENGILVPQSCPHGKQLISIAIHFWFVRLEQYRYCSYFTCGTICKNGCIVAKNYSFYQAFGCGHIYSLLVETKVHKFLVRHNSCPSNLYLIAFPMIFSLFYKFPGLGNDSWTIWISPHHQIEQKSTEGYWIFLRQARCSSSPK